MENITFYGTDASNDISLLEYGLLVSNEPHTDGSGTHFCVYRINEDSFGTGHFSDADIDSLLNGNDWMDNTDISSFLSYRGETKEQFLSNNLATKLLSLIQFAGYENICGTDYSPITEQEAIDRYLS